jgi:hypothetical protein
MFEINTDLRIKVERVQDIYWSATDTGIVRFDSSRPVEKLIFIIDNFYQNPDEVRQLTKESEVYTDKNRLAGAIGRRVWREEPELMYEMAYQMCHVFEQLCQHEDWQLEFDKEHHYQKWNSMRFVVNVTNNKEIVDSGRNWDTICHIDGPYNKWASLVYLNTPDEYGEEGSVPGTGFYSVVPPNSDGSINKPKLQYVCPVKYNRAVLYDANMVHGAIMEPDMYKDYDRLTQIMFF